MTDQSPASGEVTSVQDSLCAEVIGNPSRVGMTHQCERTAPHYGRRHLAHYTNGKAVEWGHVQTPDITHLLRANLVGSLPNATPEQIDELMEKATQMGRELRDRATDSTFDDPQPDSDADTCDDCGGIAGLLTDTLSPTTPGPGRVTLRLCDNCRADSA